MIKRKRITLSKQHKIYCLVFVVLAVILSLGIPSLARFRNRIINTTAIWSGEVATSYHQGSGTESDPYVISNGGELAYFSKMLETNDYANTYFKLSNDIILNKGLFNYTDKIEYTLDNITYYIESLTNKYYSDSSFQHEVGTINELNSFNNFKGVLDGNSYRIYGLYLTGTNDNLALFNYLEGTVKNLYIENTLINGGFNTAILASESNNSVIENVLVNGFVIGNDFKESNKEINYSDITLPSNETTYDVVTDLEELNYANINSYTLTGTTTGVITIDGIELIGDFTKEISSPNFTITYESLEDITLTNLKLSVNYNASLTAGLIAKSDNTTITNSINKANIYGNIVSSGIVANANGTSITNSYNTGNITSTKISSGLIGVSSNYSSITKSYNNGTITGEVKGGLVGATSDITIINSFDTTEHAIGANNGISKIVNSYTTGALENDFNQISLATMSSKIFGISLGLNEFVDEEDLKNNSDNVWVYGDSLPILYIDDLNNSVGAINASTYSWNSYGNLKRLNIENNITFNIESLDELNPFKEVYYYIDTTDVLKTKEELEQVEWTNYTEITSIDTEGTYVIYSKIIDSKDNLIYLNSDILVLDLSGSDVEISLNDSKWNSLDDNLNYLYIDEAKDFIVNATDNLSGISKVEYFISDKVLTKEELNNLTEWLIYDNGIKIDRLGNSIIYVKVTDNSNYVTYVNTDYISYMGYSEEISNSYITDTSLVKIDFTYSDTNSYDNTYKHSLVSNTLLPVGTKITLIDKNTGKTYQYKTSNDNYNFDSCANSDCLKEAIYPFSLFSEVGKSVLSNYEENDFNKEINEHYKVILDFSDASITSDLLNIKVYMKLSNETVTRTTLKNTIKSFNIYTNSDATSSFYVDTTKTVVLNSETTTDISLTGSLLYKTDGLNSIIDTIYQDKLMGIKIKLVDSNGNIISKEKYKNVTFKIDDTEYYPDSNNITYISLGNITNISKILSIVTTTDIITLKDGTYYFVIESFNAFDGKYTLSNAISSVSIPVTVTDKSVEYSFDCLENNDKIIDKSLELKSLTFDIIQNGDLVNPNIRVSLYKKTNLTAYNQDYTLIDLKDYTNDTLELVSDSVYYVSDNPIKYDGKNSSYNKFILNLNPSLLDYNGYKLVFELFDGMTKIGTVEKNFIVR